MFIFGYFKVIFFILQVLKIHSVAKCEGIKKKKKTIGFHLFNFYILSRIFLIDHIFSTPSHICLCLCSNIQYVNRSQFDQIILFISFYMCLHSFSPKICFVIYVRASITLNLYIYIIFLLEIWQFICLDVLPLDHYSTRCK